MKLTVILGDTVFISHQFDSRLIAMRTDGSATDVGALLAGAMEPLLIALAQELISAGYDFKNPVELPNAGIPRESSSANIALLTG